MEILETYESRREAVDEAWLNDAGSDNQRLKDGALVRLRYATVGDPPHGCRSHGLMVPAGSTGIVAYARTPRVCRKTGSTVLYFANVDVNTELGISRVRVPHSALRITPK